MGCKRALVKGMSGFHLGHERKRFLSDKLTLNVVYSNYISHVVFLFVY